MTGRLWPLLLMAALITGCADARFEEPHTRAVAPFFYIKDKSPRTVGDRYLEDEQDVFRPMTDLNLTERRDEETRRRNIATGLNVSIPAGCNLGDRFDRKALLAYNFSDKQSRLSLHMNMDAGFGGVEVDKMMVSFTYKLQPIPHRKDKCKYPSGFQGIVGSSYNEFFLREHDTVWQELRDRGDAMGLFD